MSSGERVETGSICRWVRDEAGSALVEAAMVLPLILIVVLGIFKFGVTFNHYIVLTDAVRSGARQIVISRSPGVDACAKGITRLKSVATPSLDTALLTVPTPTVTTSCTTLVVGSDATMSASYPCDLDILGFNFAPSCTLTSQVTERVE
jgi:Flp pilus assembly protein TadG